MRSSSQSRTCAEAAAALRERFPPGLQVWLASGGPPMTVDGTDLSTVCVVWFQAGELQEREFDPAMLGTIPPEEIPF